MRLSPVHVTTAHAMAPVAGRTARDAIHSDEYTRNGSKTGLIATWSARMKPLIIAAPPRPAAHSNVNVATPGRPASRSARPGNGQAQLGNGGRCETK
ncbi:hypothetical protein GCM10017624_12210 [Azotobacter vinelandii]|nr:hypothetical protein GCM10017624_12210 [Azotobacter vinelandii]